jgi:hypothetical protein
VSGVVSARFPFVVKVEALPPMRRGSVVFGELNAGYVAMCCAFPGSSVGFCTLGVNFF